MFIVQGLMCSGGRKCSVRKHYAFAFFPQGLLWCTLVSHHCGSALLCAVATLHEGAVCDVMSPCVGLSCIVTVCDMYCHRPCADPKNEEQVSLERGNARQ